MCSKEGTVIKMNKKKLVGVVCAFACAANLALSGTASADLRTVSEQADWHRHLIKVTFGNNGPEPPSAINQKTVVPNMPITTIRIAKTIKSSSNVKPERGEESLLTRFITYVPYYPGRA